MILKRNDGFTLVEIITVMVIAAILAAVAVTSVAHYITDAKETICLSNRGIFNRRIAYDTLAFAEGFDSASLLAGDNLCPMSGVYSLSDDKKQVLCSVHTAKNAAPDETPDYPVLPDGTEIKISGDWGALCQTAKNLPYGGISINTDGGNVFSDETGVYVLLGNGNYLSKTNGENNIKLSEYAAARTGTVVPVDMSKNPLVPSNRVSVNGPWKSGFHPAFGRLYLYEGSLYVFSIQSGGQWASPSPENGNWTKLIN